MSTMRLVSGKNTLDTLMFLLNIPTALNAECFKWPRPRPGGSNDRDILGAALEEEIRRPSAQRDFVAVEFSGQMVIPDGWPI